MQVHLHTRDLVWGEWESRPVELNRIPAVGDHLVLDAQGNWYQVRAVVHFLPAESPYEIELYAVKVDSLTVIKTL